MSVNDLKVQFVMFKGVLHPHNFFYIFRNVFLLF